MNTLNNSQVQFKEKKAKASYLRNFAKSELNQL